MPCRWAAVEAANQAWRPSNPWRRHYRRIAARHGKNPAKSAVARKLLISAWHMLCRQELGAQIVPGSCLGGTLTPLTGGWCSKRKQHLWRDTAWAIIENLTGHPGSE
jgi:hypothetical protein